MTQYRFSHGVQVFISTIDAIDAIDLEGPVVRFDRSTMAFGVLNIHTVDPEGVNRLLDLWPWLARADNEVWEDAWKYLQAEREHASSPEDQFLFEEACARAFRVLITE